MTSRRRHKRTAPRPDRSAAQLRARLQGAVTGQTRRTDQAQAGRLAAATRERDTARQAITWNGGRAEDQAASRTEAVRARAEANASPRAQRWAGSLETFGTRNPPGRRRQQQILTARQAASDARAAQIDRERPAHEGRSVVHETSEYRIPRRRDPR